jgi:hypothetical protein
VLAIEIPAVSLYESLRFTVVKAIVCPGNFIFKFHKFNQAPLLGQRCSQYLDIYQCFTQGNVRNNISYLINILVRLCVAPWNKIPHGWLM